MNIYIFQLKSHPNIYIFVSEDLSNSFARFFGVPFKSINLKETDKRIALDARAAIKDIKESASKYKNNFETRNKNKLNSNKTLSISLKEFYNIKNIESGNIESITLKPLENKATLKLNSGFVDDVFSKAYDVEASTIKNNLSNAYEVMAFNSIMLSELKNNKDLFLSSL